jgi:prevent-host-death family protein
MEVGVAALRADLKKWLDLVQSGEEVVVTERGMPIARLVPVREADLLAQMTREGLLSPARAPKTKLSGTKGIPVQGSVSDLIVEMRRSRDEP